jgi:multiple sugar transport system substrate-binding protein
MSFKDYDKKTFIADTARDFAARRISKRDFLRKMALAGIGFSAFNAGLLGTGHQRG